MRAFTSVHRGQRRWFRTRLILQADLRVTVLQFCDDFSGEGTAACNFGEVVGHLAEGVRGAVGEQEDGGVGWGHRMFA